MTEVPPKKLPRCNFQDLAMTDAMSFQQHFEHRTTLPIADITHKLYFMPVAANLRVGDRVSVVRYNKPPAQHHGDAGPRMMETAEFRVASKSREAIDVVVVSGPDEIPDFSIAPEERPDTPSREEFIKGDGRAVYNRRDRSWEVMLGEEIVATMFDGDLAKAVARGDLPIPEKVATAA